ncbi:MAG: hypothetical protein IJ466_06840 [Clostridia bacterium]|nr:hypothetical protein [Clostridia bacterium]
MYRKNRRWKDILRHSKKTLVMMMAMVIALSGAIGGTLAWLMDQTQTIKNTFTVGDINIKLEESDADGDQNPDDNDYEMTPGAAIDKDPKVTVLKGSKACWLYVKLDESANFGKYLSYDMAEGWKPLAGVAGVYYREVGAAADNIEFPVLKDNKVYVHGDADMSDLISGAEELPYLLITAYAVQLDGTIEKISTAEKAWELVTPRTVLPSPSPAAQSVETAAVNEDALTKEQIQKIRWSEFEKSSPDFVE